MLRIWASSSHRRRPYCCRVSPFCLRSRPFLACPCQKLHSQTWRDIWRRRLYGGSKSRSHASWTQQLCVLQLLANGMILTWFLGHLIWQLGPDSQFRGIRDLSIRSPLMAALRPNLRTHRHFPARLRLSLKVRHLYSRLLSGFQREADFWMASCNFRPSQKFYSWCLVKSDRVEAIHKSRFRRRTRPVVMLLHQRWFSRVFTFYSSLLAATVQDPSFAIRAFGSCFSNLYSFNLSQAR